ncbi:MULTISPECIES: hypothetical protein [Streptosporangium]|uniref:Thioredoxin domain-containing protein n=1 Tax=Streptosporangium brasiliense TaxID=47480 RepID=A0ABT9RAH5_9ACTN|nr:hypothetical protein [Streptosporangium brasiliense]MDP9865774.1 hypothetical protein [Streptosporangium brasiliense]
MTFLIAAVVLVGILCIFDLVLTFAVLRRLREHTAELERLAGPARFGRYDPGVLVGRTLPPVGADGGERARLVAFFDVSCDACHEHAPRFADAARADTAMAVISGDGEKAGDLIEMIGGAASVVTAEQADSLVKAVGIEAFPTFLRVDPDGTIVGADTELDALVGTARVR